MPTLALITRANYVVAHGPGLNYSAFIFCWKSDDFNTKISSLIPQGYFQEQV